MKSPQEMTIAELMTAIEQANARGEVLANVAHEQGKPDAARVTLDTTYALMGTYSAILVARMREAGVGANPSPVTVGERVFAHLVETDVFSALSGRGIVTDVRGTVVKVRFDAPDAGEFWVAHGDIWRQ